MCCLIRGIVLLRGPWSNGGMSATDCLREGTSSRPRHRTGLTRLQAGSSRLAVGTGG
jgi:hypothetical protein